MVRPLRITRIPRKGEFMAEFTDEEIEEQVLDPRLREVIKTAQKSQRELKRLQEFETQVTLGRVFDEVKIPDDPAGRMFRELYKGPATAEAVLEEATKRGIAITPPAVDPAKQAELDELKRIQQATSGTGSSSVNPWEELQAKMAKAKTPEEIQQLAQEYERVYGTEL